MKHLLFFLFATQSLFAQNVGIGTTTPRYPLSFASTLGQKVTFWDDGNPGGSNYGIGIQSGEMRINTFSIADDILLGHGSTGTFTERFRFKGNGNFGVGNNNPQYKIDVSGRIRLRHEGGSSTAGLWLGNSTNSNTPAFIGLLNDQTVGLYGINNGWGLTMNTTSGFVGLGTSAPSTRLDVAGLNNWDLGNTEGDMRIGNDSYRLKFGVALGGGGAGAVTIMQFGAAGGYNALSMGSQGKNFITVNGSGNFIDITNASGGIRINGNAGQPGQTLVSNGPGAQPGWSPSTRFTYENSVRKVSQSFGSAGGPGNPTTITVPDLTHGFTIANRVMAMITWSFPITNQPCAFCGYIGAFTGITVDGNVVHQVVEDIPNATTRISSGTIIVFLEPGSHTIEVFIRNFSSTITAAAGGNGAGVTGTLNVVLFPQ